MIMLVTIAEKVFKVRSRRTRSQDMPITKYTFAAEVSSFIEAHLFRFNVKICCTVEQAGECEMF